MSGLREENNPTAQPYFEGDFSAAALGRGVLGFQKFSNFPIYPGFVWKIAK
jgi:hypothetical protein